MEKDLKNILARGRVRAICISKERGTEKQAVPEGHFLVDFGIQGDAHAGNWHRQVSLLSYDKVEAFNQRGADVSDGAFGENLVVEGIDFASLPVGTRLCAGTAQLEMTQIGKECHSHCAIYKRMGECIMPREGVFARVIQEGIIRPGDDMTAIAPQEDRPFQAAVITLSDKGARGERKDESGPAAVHLLQEAGYQVAETLLIADEPEVLKKHLIRLADSRQVDLIITSGGTGFSLRDQTPEATLAVADRQTAGRGRRGHSWSSPAGNSIYMSVLLRPDIAPSKASMLTVVMACSAAEGITQCLAAEGGAVRLSRQTVYQGVSPLPGDLREILPRPGAHGGGFLDAQQDLGRLRCGRPQRPGAEQLRGLRHVKRRGGGHGGKRIRRFCRTAALGGRKYEQQSNRDLWEYGV